VLSLYEYPNLLCVGLASSSLVWNMYSLLSPIRYVINPRFNLTTPIQSGLFYIAPGCGYFFGTFFGGRWADRTVKRWIKKRNGERVPEDRLRSCLPFLGGVIPGCILIYGWSIEKEVGGVPLPVIVMFLQGVAQLFCFPRYACSPSFILPSSPPPPPLPFVPSHPRPHSHSSKPLTPAPPHSLNTYCLDVMQKRSSEVVAGNYLLRYLFACAGTAVCLPAIEAIGVGWFSTISSVFLVASAVLTYWVTIWGRGWREAVERRHERKAKRRIERLEEKEKEREKEREGQEQRNGSVEEHEREEHE